MTNTTLTETVIPTNPHELEETMPPASNLRRLDWRFLLPAPPTGNFRHLLLLGGPSTLAASIVASKLAQEVSVEITPGLQADAVVLLHDSHVTMVEAAAALAPGGVFYQEVARTSFSSFWITPQRLRRQLTNRGLHMTGYYWAASNFEHCRRYIPLDAPSAATWYFASLFVAGTPLLWFMRTLFMLIATWGSSALAWFLPYISFTAVRDSGTSSQPALLRAARDASALSDAKLHPMLVTSGQDDASRLIMLPFAPGRGREPEAVIKIATDPKFNRETEVEATVLREVRSKLDDSMRASIPEPRAAFHHHDLAVSVESCAPGKTIWASSGGWRVAEETKLADLTQSARWLIEFHRQTENTRPTWDQHAISQWIEQPLAAYAQVRTMSDAETRLFALMREQAHKLMGVDFPLVWQHNDYAPWNLYRAGSRLTVIDWEFNRHWETTRAGPVLCDLLYFVTYWHNVARHLYSVEAELDGMRQLFVEVTVESSYVQAVRQAVAAYMVALNVDWRFLPLLLVYTWAERVVYSYARGDKLRTAAKSNRAADKFAKYVKLLAHNADALFAEDHLGFWQSMYFKQSKSPIQSTSLRVLR